MIVKGDSIAIPWAMSEKMMPKYHLIFASLCRKKKREGGKKSSKETT
jgi:hypothetical protein